ELEGEIGRAAQDGVGGGRAPDADGRLGERSGQRFANQQALVRIGDALVITLRQAEAARLVKVVLRRRKLQEISARFGNGAVGAGGPGVDENEHRRLAAPEKVSP